MKLENKDFVAFKGQPVKFLFPVSVYLPVGVHGTDSRVAEGEIIIGKIIHGDIAGEFHKRKGISVFFPEICPVAVLHRRAVKISAFRQKLRRKRMDDAFRPSVAHRSSAADAFQDGFAFLQDGNLLFAGNSPPRFMHIAVAGQFMPPAGNRIDCIPIGFRYNSGHKEGGLDTDSIQHIKAAGKPLVRPVLSSGIVCKSNGSSLALCAGNSEKLRIIIKCDHHGNPLPVRPGQVRAVGLSVNQPAHNRIPRKYVVFLRM